jgi:hypothetical protein
MPSFAATAWLGTLCGAFEIFDAEKTFWSFVPAAMLARAAGYGLNSSAG